MKEKFCKALAIAACVGSIGLMANPASAAEEPIRLNMTTAYMERHPVPQKAWLPWIEEVKKKTNGRLQIEFFNTNTLCPEKEHFDAVRKGQIDIGHQTIGQNQGRFPVNSIMDIPNAATNSMSASEAYWNFYASNPEAQAEFEGIKLLGIHSSAPNQMDMAKGEIKTLKDFKGKKLLTVSGDGARILRALGASPMVTPASDFYLSLSRNMANGCMLPMAPLRSLKISDALSSITVCNLRLDLFWIGMNQAKFDSLPEDCKKVIDEYAGLRMSLMIGQALYDGDQADRVGLAKDGIKMNPVSAAERQKWIDIAVPPLKQNWMNQLKQRKIGNPQALWAKAQKACADAEKKWGHLSNPQ